MPIVGDYMGMALTIDDVDKENREFFGYCDKGEFRLQKGKEAACCATHPPPPAPGRQTANTTGFPLKAKARCIPTQRSTTPSSQRSRATRPI